MTNNQLNSNWLILIALCNVIALQVLIGVIYVVHFIPIHLTDPVTHQIVQPPPGLELERDIFFYGVYLTLVGGAFLTGLVFFKDTIESSTWFNQAKWLLAVEAGWLGLLLFAAFKVLVYRYPFYNFMPVDNSAWIAPFFIATAVGACLSKVFWPEIYKYLNSRYETINLKPLKPEIKITGMIIAAILTLWMLSTPLMPWTKPAVLALLCFIGFGILCFYVTGSIWLALAGVWFFMKMNLFNYSLIPVPWVSPDMTASAQCFEPLFFVACWWLIIRRHWVALIMLVTAFCIGYLCWLGPFINHASAAPIYFSLRVRQFSSYIFGLALPIFYMIILLTCAFNALVRRHLDNTPLLLILTSAYGLMAHAVYLLTPTIGGYGRVIMPWILIVVILLHHVLGKLRAAWRRPVAIGIMLIALLSLTTNRMFVIYHLKQTPLRSHLLQMGIEPRPLVAINVRVSFAA